MSVFPSTMRSRTWILWVTALSLVLGGLLAASLKTQRNLRMHFGVSPSSRGGFAAELYTQVNVNEKLRKEIKTLNQKNAEWEKRFSGNTNQSQALYNELQSAKFFAGLKPAIGEGIVVTLKDGKPKEMPAGLSDEMVRQMAEDYLVHESDIRDVINELCAAGAEAVAVNDQRVVATTPIRCVGPVVLVNQVKLAPPIKIKAIGNSHNMMSALEMPNGLLHTDLGAYGMIEAAPAKRVFIPMYAGSTGISYAKEAPEGE